MCDTETKDTRVYFITEGDRDVFGCPHCGGTSMFLLERLSRQKANTLWQCFSCKALILTVFRSVRVGEDVQVFLISGEKLEGMVIAHPLDARTIGAA